MKRNSKILVRQMLATALAVALVLPGAAFGGGKSGKKNFKEGTRYAANQQWDLAAQEFALAVSAEPDNAEYRLHYARALQQASIMFLKRGDTLAEQKDFASAYNAYRQSFAYDPSNEMAMVKMKRMLELQKAASGLGEAVSYNPHTGNIVPTSSDVRVASKPRTLEAQKLVRIQDQQMKTWITQMGGQLGLNVLFDETVRDTRVSLELRDVSWARALDLMLIQNKLAYELIDRKTVFIYPDNPTNRQKFEKLMIKTFYLGNAKHTEVRTAVQGLISTAGGGRQIASLEQVNALIVRATPVELQLVQDIIKSIDKNKAEVVVDINIYEVARNDSLEIGNQLALQSQSVNVYLRDSSGNVVTDSDGRPVIDQTLPSAFLGNLGGIGRAAIGAIAGNTANPFLGGVGTLFGLPPTSLSLLQGRGRTRLLYNSQIHALDGQQNQTKVGRSVPVRTGTNFGAGFGGPIIAPGQGGAGGQQGGIVNQGLGFGSGGLFDNIQYKDVGLVIDVTPTITNEGYIEIKMKLESTAVEASGEATNLTPVFSQRSLSTTARVLDGVTAVVAGVRQDTKSDSRSTIPFVGLVPVLGRFFTTPKQSSQESDLVITVTPHITRAPQIDSSDHLAQVSGPMQGGMSRSLEEVVQQIQADEEQEKRMIAQTAPPVASPGAAGTIAGAPASVPSAANQGIVVNTVSSSAVPAGSNPGGSGVRTIPQTPSGAPVQEASFTPPPAAQPGQPQSDQQQPGQQPAVPERPEGAPAGSEAKGEPGKGEKESAEGAPGVQRGAGAEKKAAGEEDPPPPVVEPSEPVPQARVVPPQWPEHIRKAVEKEMALAREREKEEQSKPKPQEIPVEYLNQPKPTAPVQRASVRPVSRPDQDAGSPQVNLALTPQSDSVSVGKSVQVAVTAGGLTQLTNAVLVFKFDPARIRIDSVRPGAALGREADVVHQVTGGMLRVTINHTKPLVAGGLINIELSALAEGEATVELFAERTSIALPGNMRARSAAAPLKLTFSK